MVDYYQVLGVVTNASPVGISFAYRQRALIVHPDRNPDRDTTVEFQMLREAYDVLIDPNLRASYDQGRIQQRALPASTLSRIEEENQRLKDWYSLIKRHFQAMNSTRQERENHCRGVREQRFENAQTKFLFAAAVQEPLSLIRSNVMSQNPGWDSYDYEVWTESQPNVRERQSLKFELQASGQDDVLKNLIDQYQFPKANVEQQVAEINEDYVKEFARYRGTIATRAVRILDERRYEPIHLRGRYHQERCEAWELLAGGEVMANNSSQLSLFLRVCKEFEHWMIGGENSVLLELLRE